MPVRIYDIAKKLGIENKEVLTKAKELGITGARVPSSSLDKITAEYLEEQLRSLQPQPAQEHTPPPAPEPIVIVTAPEEPVIEEPPAPPVEPIAEPVAAEPDELEPVAAQATVEEPTTELTPETPAEPAAPAEPEEPEEPSKPQLGDKIGFIQLPTRPQPRGREARPAQRPTPGRAEPVRGRMDTRAPRPGLAPAGRAQRPPQPGGRPPAAAPAEPKHVVPDDAQIITVKPPIIVRDLAEKLGRKPFQLLADLIEMKVMAHVNQAIDESVAQHLCAKYGFRFDLEKRDRGASLVTTKTKKEVELDVEDSTEDMKSRAPVVTIMGHVDHGKTSLLDVIRKTNVVQGEAGGITQHIGAYTISVPHPEHKEQLAQITFLDTPGHAAFSAMRARGADVTDIVVLVVAANDGVMPQTLEALDHAKAAGVPIIVAVNKCDHPAANAMRVRQQLQEKAIVPDEWGGETIFVDVSAVTKEGIDKLLEMILLQAELLELKANPNRRAVGNVIESGIEPGGPTATVLVRKGTLRVSDTIICGPFYGKVRALINEEGARLKQADPSVAVRVLGLNGVPEAGAEFNVLEDEKEARSLAEQRQEEAKQLSRERSPKVSLEDFLRTASGGGSKVLKLVVKSDTQGSSEAIVDALKKIDSEKVTLDVIHSAVGTITEGDVLLASASKGVILGFHTRIDSGVSEVAKREGVQIRLYSIIYELVDEVKESMAGLLEPTLKETVIGAAEVRQIFPLSKGGVVAGCVVQNGRISKGKVRVQRRKSTVFEGNISSLRRFQDEVNEVRSGMECGIRVDGFNDWQEGDMIESFTVEEVAPKL